MAIGGLGKCHNPCFSGNSFTIGVFVRVIMDELGHNPCFSGNSFTILFGLSLDYLFEVTILVLVETPLQSKAIYFRHFPQHSHNPCFSGNSFTI